MNHHPNHKNDIEWNKKILVSEFDLTWNTIIVIFSVFWTAGSPPRWREGAMLGILAPLRLTRLVTCTSEMSVTSPWGQWSPGHIGWCHQASHRTTHAASASPSGQGPPSSPASTVSSTSGLSSGEHWPAGIDQVLTNRTGIDQEYYLKFLILSHQRLFCVRQ